MLIVYFTNKGKRILNPTERVHEFNKILLILFQNPKPHNLKTNANALKTVNNGDTYILNDSSSSSSNTYIWRLVFAVLYRQRWFEAQTQQQQEIRK